MYSQLLLSVVIFASLSIILSPLAQGPLVQAELGSAFAYRKNYLLSVVIFASLSIPQAELGSAFAYRKNSSFFHIL